MNGRLVVVTGYPASGKDTIVRLFLEKKPDFKHIVSYTDRPKRPGEVEGREHHFINTTTFHKMLHEGYFLEHVLHGSHYKATTKDAFLPALKGENILWRIDLTRAAILEETFEEKFKSTRAKSLIQRTTKFVIRAPNIKVAESRYKKRDPNFDLIEFKKRYTLDHKTYLNNKDRLPNLIINKTGKLNEALNEIERLLEITNPTVRP